jgi:hypothetical protein
MDTGFWQQNAEINCGSDVEVAQKSSWSGVLLSPRVLMQSSMFACAAYPFSGAMGAGYPVWSERIDQPEERR